MKDFLKKSAVFGLIIVCLEFVWFFTVGKTWIENNGCKVYINNEYKGKSDIVEISSDGDIK